MDLRGSEGALPWTEFLENRAPAEDTDEIVLKEVHSFSTRLVEGVLAEQVSLDEHIVANAKNWSLERMAVTDRCCLRLGVFELLHCPDIPAAVTLNEIIDLETCHYTNTAHEDYIIDRHPENATCVIGSGFSGHGFKLGPVTGRALVDLAIDGSPSCETFQRVQDRFKLPGDSP